MVHHEEGELQAYLDEELPAERTREIREHLRECAPCRGLLEDVRAREALVGTALAAEGREAPDVEAARWEVRRRWASRRARTRRQWSLRAAAVIVLISGALGVALPDSPLRALVSEGWDRVVALVVEGDAGEPGQAAEEREAGAAGPEGGEAGPARVATEAGPEGLEVRLEGVRDGTVIRVVRVEGRTGAVEVEGESGGFGSAEGSLRAEVGEGPARVELPDDAVAARLLVDGEVLAVLRDGRLETPGRRPDESGEGTATFRY